MRLDVWAGFSQHGRGHPRRCAVIGLNSYNLLRGRLEVVNRTSYSGRCTMSYEPGQRLGTDSDRMFVRIERYSGGGRHSGHEPGPEVEISISAHGA
jgi:hypothetical protein